MFERFTPQARDVVVGAQYEARQLRHPYIGTEHLMLALLASETGIPHMVLREKGVDAQRLRTEIERLIGTPPKYSQRGGRRGLADDRDRRARGAGQD